MNDGDVLKTNGIHKVTVTTIRTNANKLFAVTSCALGVISVFVGDLGNLSLLTTVTSAGIAAVAAASEVRAQVAVISRLLRAADLMSQTLLQSSNGLRETSQVAATECGGLLLSLKQA